MSRRTPSALPVLIEAIDHWLAGAPVERLPRLPLDRIAWHEVGPAVNVVRNDGPEEIRPIEEQSSLL